MAPNRKISVPSAGRILGRLGIGGQKTAAACGLLLVMLFMWVRVFVGHQPAAATAAPPSAQAPSAPHQGPVKVKLVELPKLPGRHDAIQEDFFTAKDQAYLRRNSAGRKTGTDREVPVGSSSDAQDVIQRLTQTVKLEAVLWSESPRAFINDQLLSVGGKLTVKDGTAVFEFEVLQIYVDSVLVGCAGIHLTLELAQKLETVN
ncbi:MAG: hypothetical protein NTZ17_10330 [Phycisphaerae bacterium]|nr:hypothetical protein [Phycisphaerae bacterium]